MQVPEELSFWFQFQAVIAQISKNFDQVWQLRKRVITTQFLVLFIFKLVLSQNRQGYGSLLTELWSTSHSVEELTLPQATPISASSFCAARQKMPETIFQEINQAILRQWTNCRANKGWKGHRVFGIDGSKVNLPRALVKNGYEADDGNRQHYPIGLFSTLYHLGEGMIYDFKLSAQKDERLSALEHIKEMEPNDVLVLDRGYFSYEVLHQAMNQMIFLVCRLSFLKKNPAIKKFFKGKATDKIILYEPSNPVKSRLKKRGFQGDFKPIPLRLIKYRIDNNIYVCATTLTDSSYSVEELGKLYHARWGIEELYKISKQLIGVDDFHSQTERGVKQELYAHCVLINLARIFESQASNDKNNDDEPKFTKPIDSDIKNSYWQGFLEDLRKMKINFKHCLIILRQYLEKLLLGNSKDILNRFASEALFFMARVKQRIRPGRHYTRQSLKPLNKWVTSNQLNLSSA